jgi:hypothetical protein
MSVIPTIETEKSQRNPLKATAAARVAYAAASRK